MSSSPWRARLDGLDLTDTAREFVEELIDENERLRTYLARHRAAPDAPAPRETLARPLALDTRAFPDSRVLVTLSASGLAKRTEINAYGRQRRGGVGAFDLRVRDDDPARFLAVADTADHLLLLTQQGRVYRVAVAALPLTERNGKGEPIGKLCALPDEERVAAVLALAETDLQRYILLASQTGFVKRMRAHYFGPTYEQGKTVLDPRQTGGPAAAMCLSGGSADILLVSRQAMATRFSISAAPLQAAPGIKLRSDDSLIGIVAVNEGSAVAVLTADGLGTRRLMEGFIANKAPGAAGKIMMKTDEVAGVALAPDGAELIALTRFGKAIRFEADEIPAKTAPVQGVDIVEVRGDAVTAVASLE